MAAPSGTFNLLDVSDIIFCAFANSFCVLVTPFNATSNFCICAEYRAAAAAAFTVSTAAPMVAPATAPAGPPTAPPAKASCPVVPSCPPTVPANAPSAAL